jgi:hypothetical protein
MRPADVMAITKSSIGAPRGTTTFYCRSLYAVPQRAIGAIVSELAASPSWPYFLLRG